MWPLNSPAKFVPRSELGLPLIPHLERCIRVLDEEQELYPAPLGV
jgi:hypothetical protein